MIIMVIMTMMLQISRSEAEETLSKIAVDGAFLVRPGERVAGSFAVSFRAENKVGYEINDMMMVLMICHMMMIYYDNDTYGQVKHCLIKKEGRLFTIGTAQFESLLELVAYYEKNPLYRL